VNGEDYCKELDASKIMIHGKWIDEYTDLYVSMKEIFRRNMTLRQYASTLTGDKVFGSLSSADPLPFLAETLMIPILSRR
jgi:hypothetical protein